VEQGASPAPGSGLLEQARRRAEYRPWAALLDATREATRWDAWSGALPEAPGDRAPGIPLLAGATFTVDGRLLRRWLRRLVAETSLDPAADAGTDRLAALLEAGLLADAARVAALAAMLGVDPGALGAVAGLAPVPLLRVYAGRWGARVSPAWQEGYCPVCGAWPTLAEARGLEHARRLRCGRCAADWGTTWLRCSYCGNDAHDRLGSLVPRHAPSAMTLDTCAACRGYLKTVTTLTPTAADDLALLDLATVELDAAALEHGYARPEGLGVPLDASVMTPASPRRWWRP
jgi:FdhE protein